MNLVKHTLANRLAALMVLFSLAACSGSSDDGGSTTGGSSTSGSSTSGSTDSGSTDAGTSTGAFTLDSVGPISLEEGNPAGANIPINLTRIGGHSKPISISIAGASDSDNRLITFGIFPDQIPAGESYSSINLGLAIDDLPIMPQQRIFYIDANDGTDTARATVRINVQPVDAPDVYLLAGQSNMVGFSGAGTKLANAGGPDEPHPRIYQLNVSKNNNDMVFIDAEDYSDENVNVINSARIVQAEDPLHVPLDPTNSSGKESDYIGMGMSFAKAALNDTTKNIILVPAAWSGSAFCANAHHSVAQWNAQPTDNPNLGNTWLFDRAVTRANIALAETGGILRGILWHQGESDRDNSQCAAEYLANLERLAQQLRLQINADLRGGDLRRPDANIPFVVGTMSRGKDERGDYSVFPPNQQLIDDAHRTIPSKVRHSAITINDDLTPDNGYPCGNGDCIHYGAAALREMGSRYYDGLLRAVANP